MGAGEAEGRPQGAASLWLRKVTCIGGTAGRDRQPHGLQGQRDRGLGGGKAPEGEMVPGGWVWTKTGPPSWVKPLPSNPESHWCHCSHPPCLPKPAAPPSTHGCCGHPRHGRGAQGAQATNPPYRPAPLLRARSHHKPRCFLRVSFLAVHYANPLTPKDLSFLFSPVLARLCSGEPSPRAEATS